MTFYIGLTNNKRREVITFLTGNLEKKDFIKPSFLQMCNLNNSCNNHVFKYDPIKPPSHQGWLESLG